MGLFSIFWFGDTAADYAGACHRAAPCADPLGSNPLIKAVVDDFATSEGRAVARDGLKDSLSGKKPAEVKTACIEILRRADSVLTAKAPGDAAAFKNWLREISENVAEASTEGGFLGIGGVVVSDTEKATLAEISSALKLPS